MAQPANWVRRKGFRGPAISTSLEIHGIQGRVGQEQSIHVRRGYTKSVRTASPFVSKGREPLPFRLRSLRALTYKSVADFDHHIDSRRQLSKKRRRAAEDTPLHPRREFLNSASTQDSPKRREKKRRREAMDHARSLGAALSNFFKKHPLIPEPRDKVIGTVLLCWLQWRWFTIVSRMQAGDPLAPFFNCFHGAATLALLVLIFNNRRS